MKYIITGGSGFIGTHFSEKLGNRISLNIDIEKPKTFNSNYQNINILDMHSLINIDITSPEKSTLIHLAAVHFDFQKGYYQTNVEGTRNILDFIEKNKIKNFVFFSSVAIYGNSENGKNENSEKKPINDYGKSKLQAENLIRQWHSENSFCRVIIVRPAVVFGEYNFGNVFNLIKQINSKIYAVVGDGKNIKSIAYSKNLVDSVLFALENINDNYYEYNYCDYPQLNTTDISKKISKKLNYTNPLKIPLLLTKLISFPIDILEKLFASDLKFNSQRIKKFTESTYFMSDKIRQAGFLPRFSLDQCFDRTINWIKENDVDKMRQDWYNKAKKL